MKKGYAKIIFICFFSLFSCLGYAQIVQFFYITEAYPDLVKKVRQDEMVLNIDTEKNMSSFYSIIERDREKVKDSVFAQGGNAGDVLNAREKLCRPPSFQYYEIYKNYPQKGEITFIDKLLFNYYRYVEQLKKPVWTITNEKKEILTYECQKATANYLGRNWAAWFTLEMPVSEGPWKLCGLPGIILEASDIDQNYTFKCISIKRSKSNETILPPKNRKYTKISKKEYWKLHKESATDPETFVTRFGQPYSRGWDMNGKPLPPRKVLYNPIERQNLKE